MFQFDQKETFAEREERILRFWQEGGVFKRSVEMNRGQPLFSFYDGPPFATGLPHYGHLLAGTLKDVIPRYKTMKGFYVPRRFGWDCHGLPIENEIEKTQQLSGATSIEAFGIAQFNEECRKIVLRYSKEWKKTVDRMGRWVDFDHTYHTMDRTFMESVWWVCKQLYQRDLIYEGFKVMPFSMKLGTPISNFEANLNYKEVDDPSITVQFQLVDQPNTYFLAWTTTPWTLPSNLALMVGPDISYVKIRKGGKNYILAHSRVASLFKEEGEMIEQILGRHLQNVRYQPLFPFFSDRAKEGAFRVLLEDSVSTEEGTGIVHVAPAFGEVDFFVCRRENLDPVCPVDSNGYFTLEVPPYAGMLVKDADREIIRDLKRLGMLFSAGTIRHRYPFCWRSDTPLIYKAVRTWFVAVEKIKNRLLETNQMIHWVPEHIKEGRFGKWLEQARDWAISRNRYWGTPIPIWRSDRGDLEVIGSIQELEELTGRSIQDLHRHHIDDLTFKKNGAVFKRIPEVFDCWFESGSMPYAQNHYPFEHQKEMREGFPADFIAEGIDQTRGWFYTLHVLASALFGSNAFKNVIVNGIILAEDGEKMSKRLRNYPDPDELFQTYGADAVRLYLLQSPAVRAEDLRFSKQGVEQILRSILIPLWNSFVFLSTYAKIYQWQPSLIDRLPQALIDRWLLSMTQKLISDVQGALDQYQLDRAVDPLMVYVDQLTNWYIRRCRNRFWADEDTQDRQEAFATLYTALLTLVKVAAPFTPFCTDAIYRELAIPSMPESVHLAHYPVYHSAWRNEVLEHEVEAAQQAVSLGHALRKEYKLKVRQPLAKAHLITENSTLMDSLRSQAALIAEELNVKEIEFHHREEEFVQWFAKPNFATLGKRLGKRLPLAQQEIAHFNRQQMRKLLEGHNLSILVADERVALTAHDVQIVRMVKEGLAAETKGELTVALDLVLTDELRLEGLARELVNRINTMRREQNFDVTDRIHLTLETTDRVKECFQTHGGFIRGEILALDVQFGPCSGERLDLNGEETKISLQRVST
jgi:isoleucyl-tRNA synthetase